MKVLVCGDSPTVNTGFSRCTRALCDALAAAGHHVSLVGINESGDGPSTRSYPVADIYMPIMLRDGCVDYFGSGRTAVLAATIRPDVIVLINDPWNVPSHLSDLATVRDRAVDTNTAWTVPPIVAWLAVDSRNQANSDRLNPLSHIVCWTNFALNELRSGGYTGPASVIPLGIDPDHYTPVTPDLRTSARARYLPAGDIQTGFIVGVVGRNQPRKRLDLTLAYFAEWVHTHNRDDAYLYLHVAPTGEASADLVSLTRYYGIAGRVLLGRKLALGTGLPETEMSSVYHCFDAYLTTSQAEGWGLPALEAMACGIPCILPDFAAFGPDGWVPPAAALRVPCTSTALSAPLNGTAYTIGGVPDRAETIMALDTLYRDPQTRAQLASAGLQCAANPDFRWPSIGARIRSIVEQAGQGGGAASVAAGEAEADTTVPRPQPTPAS